MTELKICGITRLDDALCAIDSGTDALGFIFYPQSPRFIAPAKAKPLIAALPRQIMTVGVFVNEPPERVAAIAAVTGIDLIQLHGDESPAYCRAFPAGRLIKAVTPRIEADLTDLEAYAVRAFLIDARRVGLYGGTGRQADWSLAAKLAERVPLILAGGLNEDNIVDALSLVKPAALDLNSGVESSPGIKDHGRLRRACTLIRRTSPPDEAVIFHREWAEPVPAPLNWPVTGWGKGAKKAEKG